MPDLAIDYPQSVRVYADKPVYSRDGDYTIMTVKQVIIPRETGKITLPALSINWFNTESGEQQTSELAGLDLTVKPGSATQAPVMPTPDASTPVKPESAATTNGSTTVVSDAGFCLGQPLHLRCCGWARWCCISVSAQHPMRLRLETILG